MANLHLHKGAHSFSSWERGCSSQELAGKLFFSYLGIIHKIGSFRKNHQHYFRKGCELWRRLDRNIRWLEPVSIFTMTSLYYICLHIFTLKDLKYEYHHFFCWCFLPHWISQQHYHHHNHIVIFQPSLRIANLQTNVIITGTAGETSSLQSVPTMCQRRPM